MASRRANGPARPRLRRLRRLRAATVAASLVGLAGLAALDAWWIEPRLLLVRDEVSLAPPAPPAAGLTLVHLADLHVVDERPNLRRLLRRVAAERPAAILVAGDFVSDPDPETLGRSIPAAAAFAGELRRIAPVYAVQGHSDYLGETVAALAEAGVEWLSNDGRRLGRAVLYGLNQQVGYDRYVPPPDFAFRPVAVPGAGLAFGKRSAEGRNFYSHFDPLPVAVPDVLGGTGVRIGDRDLDGVGDLGDIGGPLAWSGYDTSVEVWIDRPETGAGLVVHSHLPVGEHRLVRLARARPDPAESGTFMLTFNGTYPQRGRLDTGVAPEPGRWYRLRVATEVAPGRVVVRGKAWPADTPEPAAWQAWAEDRSPRRLTAGTVGLWTWGHGTVAFRHLRVVPGGGGDPLLGASLAGPGRPADWRDGIRASRLELALARGPRAAPGTPRLVLSHSPDVAPEAALLGLDAVLAGHTHGGQVRLPGWGALTARSALGRRFARGLFAFRRPGREGPLRLYVNPGVGTSLLPVRFATPPTYARVRL